MGTIRIIAGSMRGRRIEVAERPNLRPTSDRVRESLFNLLGQRLDGWDVLDLYAGTGVLGIESLSRGARRVVFVEKDAKTRRILRANLRRLGIESRARVLGGEVRDELARSELGSFELVLADPPYDDPAASALPEILEATRVVRDEGLFVIEQDAGAEGPRVPANWKLRREARYGRTVLRIYDRARRKSLESVNSTG